MACAKPNNCAPCSKCPDTPTPVVPRCNNVVLNDGTFPNATVVVEDGCIVSVTTGTPLLYQPDNNCAGSGEGGGGGGETLLPEPGEAGPAGTISINSVSTLAPGSMATVNNIGTPSAAVLNIGIPAGTPGVDGGDPPGGANSTAGALVVEGGRVMEPLPVVWPPVFDVIPDPPIGAGASILFTKNPANGVITAQLDVSGLITTFQSQIDAMQDVIDSMQATIDNHETRIVALEP
jgi:hypothetical protein